MNMPADIRRAIGLEGSGHLIATVVDNEVRITTTQHALKRVRDLAAPYKPIDGNASDQLIEERRQEAASESNEIGGDYG